MRTLLLLAVALFQGCNCGGPTCTPTGGGDAGPQPRTQGEPCTDGFGCATGLECRYTTLGPSFRQQECLAPCSDAGTCASGTACFEGACLTTCTVDGDCPGRFVASCRPVDAGLGRGFCGSASCNRSESCPGSSTCIMPLYCCPPGAPCAAPPDGFCLR